MLVAAMAQRGKRYKTKTKSYAEINRQNSVKDGLSIKYDYKHYHNLTDVILNNILFNKDIKDSYQKKELVSWKAMELSSTLLNLSPSLKRMQYENGFSTGKSLYENISKNKYDALPEEMIIELVNFFERVGYDKVTVHFIFDGIEMHFYNIKNTNNDFESGIIAGFLNALYKNRFYVNESMIGNTKIFKASQRLFDDANLLPSKTKEVEDIYNTLGSIIENTDKKFLKSYWLLSRSALLNKNIAESIPEVGVYMGIMFGKILSTTNPRNKRNYIVKLIEMIRDLGFGEPEIISKKPLHIKIYYESYDNINFINFASAFLDNTLSNFLNLNILDNESSKDGRYIVDIKEQKEKQ